ncbi:hypothetical protein FrEUN1fDRAFT_3599 [Parafrankia sp. EUN1f]|nr:hypothetical protein FrEUN1fDRAFT_3599 [Parafrankia sp. EUN1f]
MLIISWHAGPLGSGRTGALGPVYLRRRPVAAVAAVAVRAVPVRMVHEVTPGCVAAPRERVDFSARSGGSASGCSMVLFRCRSDDLHFVVAGGPGPAARHHR